MSERNTAWTPYGLEAIRIARLRRQRIIALLLGAGVILAILTIGGTTSTKTTEIFVNGAKQNSISIDKPEPPKNGPVTVSLTPGRVTQADSGGQSPTSSSPRTSAPILERAVPYNWAFFAYVFGPWIFVALALWLLGRRRGKNDELNYGIYKGAMPLEMITKTAERDVFTRRHAKTSVFGKRRADHLTPEVLRAESALEGST